MMNRTLAGAAPMLGYGFKDHEPEGLIYFRHRSEMVRELRPGEFLYFAAVRLRSVEELRRHLVPNVDGGCALAQPWEAISHQAKRYAGRW